MSTRRTAVPVGLLLCAVAAGGTPAGARPSATASPVRPWGGTWVRSLDATRVARHRASAAAPPPPTRERADVRLSDERTFTRWAYVARRRPIYRRPSGTAARVGRLRWYTEDGFPEIYL